MIFAFSTSDCHDFISGDINRNPNKENTINLKDANNILIHLGKSSRGFRKYNNAARAKLSKKTGISHQKLYIELISIIINCKYKFVTNTFLYNFAFLMNIILS